MKYAGFLALLSAAIHGVGCVLSGFSANGLFLLGPGVLFALLGLALLRAVPASAWISFILLMGSAAAAVGNLVTPSTVPDVTFWGILVVNLAAVVLLFGAIWVGPKAQPEG